MVFIGDIIAREEEYLNSWGTFVDSEGNIRSSVIGNVRKDDAKKTIYVKGKLVLPAIGDTVFAVVTDVKEKVVLLNIQEIKGKKNENKVLQKTSGVMFIANLSHSYLENPRQALKIGDLVKAQLIGEDVGAYILSIKDQDYGVVLGFCSRCRSKLYEKEKDIKLKDCHVMVCSKCKAIETRKTAPDYFYKGEKV